MMDLNALSLCFAGTPVQNDLQEFYAIIEFVNPGILGSTTAYRKVYEEPILRSRQPCCTEVTHLSHTFFPIYAAISPVLKTLSGI